MLEWESSAGNHRRKEFKVGDSSKGLGNAPPRKVNDVGAATWRCCMGVWKGEGDTMSIIVGYRDKAKGCC